MKKSEIVEKIIDIAKNPDTKPTQMAFAMVGAALGAVKG